jgi:hypothetical protein
MQDGYVKLWRKTLEKGWLSNHKLWVFWSWCLMRASYLEHDVIVGFQTVHLMPGDFIFGINAASRELNISAQSIRTILNRLKTAQNLTIKITNKFSVISVVNWDTYQSDVNDSNGLQIAQNLTLKSTSKSPMIPVVNSSICQSDDNQVNNQINRLLTSHQQATNNIQEREERKKERNIKTHPLPEKTNDGYSEDFLAFYGAYPKKRSKDTAWRAWKNRNGSKPDIGILLEAIEKQSHSEQWIKEGGKFIPYPATWLNAGGWDDEIEEKQIKAKGGIVVI